VSSGTVLHLTRSGGLVASGTLSNWLVPAVIAVIVIVAIWFGWRWMRAEHLETLAAVPLFSGLSKHDLLVILNSAKVEEFAPGTTMVTEGEAGKAFYVITKGRAKVAVEGKDVATLEEGAYFGEMGALDGGPRAATIVAETAVDTLELTRTALLHVLDHEPAVARSVYNELVQHLKDAGGAAPMTDDANVTSAQIADVAKRLREVEHPGWGPSTSRTRRRLSFTKMYAKGN
jgi:CRP/FNR family transcriptional regulator, cyclic AMP receptor protein